MNENYSLATSLRTGSPKPLQHARLELGPQVSRDLRRKIALRWARQQWRAERGKHSSIARMNTG